jgi:hypothetical protein
MEHIHVASNRGTELLRVGKAERSVDFRQLIWSAFSSVGTVNRGYLPITPILYTSKTITVASAIQAEAA